MEATGRREGKTHKKRLRVDSSACQKMACHFLRCHFGDLVKILVPKLWQGILATKWHAIFNVPFWTLRKNFGAKIMARYFNVPFIMCHFGHLEKILVPTYGKVFWQQYFLCATSTSVQKAH